VGPSLSLADLHLGAMLAYFVQASEGEALLRRHARLTNWWQSVKHRSSFAATDPGLP
jgi:glutathione S-transferase